MQKKVIAVFGGSFNPPINSHIKLAKQIIAKCNIVEKVLFVPVSTKYKKAELANDEHRYNMLKIVCNDEDKLDVSDIELRQNKQLYTIQTLELIKKQYKNKYDIWFVMGTDNLKEIESWNRPEQLLKKYKILVLERENDRLEDIISSIKLLSENRKSLVTINGIKRIDLSATMVRNKIKKDEDVSKYLPKEVFEYIKENKLYK